MTYCQTITSSTTWTCPKEGKWRVVAVGGGGGGYAYYNDSDTASGGSGGSTSFGSYVSASGGSSGATAGMESFYIYVTTSCMNNTIKGIGGINGFNGGSVKYGSKSTLRTGLGYGASGGGSNADGKGYVAAAGAPGEVKSIELDLTKGASITCTIGSAGSAKAGTKTYAYAGKAGAIFLRYIGESA